MFYQTLASFFGKGRKVHRTLTNPCYNLQIFIWVKILSQSLNLMSFLKSLSIGLEKSGFEKKSQSRSQKIQSKKKSQSRLKKFGPKKVSESVSKIFGLKKSLGTSVVNICSRKKKSQYRARQYLVSKKVSVSVSDEISGLVTL